MIEPPPRLSPAGQARRDHILTLALREGRRRRRRRQTLRACAVCALLLLAIPPVMRWARPHGPKVVLVRQKPDHPQPQAMPELTIHRIATEHGLAERLAIPRQHWQRIGDDELLRQLAEGHLAGGLVVVHGRQTLWLPSDSTRGQSASPGI